MFELQITEFGATSNAWEAFGDIVLLAAIVSAVGLAALRVAQSNLPLPASMIVAALGALATLLIVYRIIDPPNGAQREYGLYLGLVAAAAMALGAGLATRDERPARADI